MPTSTRRMGEIFIENREENTRVTRRSLFLSQLSMVENRIPLEFLTHLQKATPRGLYRHLG